MKLHRTLSGGGNSHGGVKPSLTDTELGLGLVERLPRVRLEGNEASPWDSELHWGWLSIDEASLIGLPLVVNLHWLDWTSPRERVVKLHWP